MATELAWRLPGGHIGVIYANPDPDPGSNTTWGFTITEKMKEDPEWLEGARHAVAIDESGWLYDVNGQHDPEGFREVALDAWQARQMVVMSVPEFDLLFENDLYRNAPAQDEEFSSKVAELVLNGIDQD